MSLSEARSQKTETGNQKPEIRSQKPLFRNLRTPSAVIPGRALARTGDPAFLRAGKMDPRFTLRAPGDDGRYENPNDSTFVGLSMPRKVRFNSCSFASSVSKTLIPTFFLPTYFSVSAIARSASAVKFRGGFLTSIMTWTETIGVTATPPPRR